MTIRDLLDAAEREIDVTVEQLALLCGCSTKTVYRRLPQIPGVRRLGRRYRIPKRAGIRAVLPEWTPADRTGLR